MAKNPLNKGILTRHTAEIGTVSPGMVRARAREIALADGRSPSHPSKADLEQAQRELTGGPEMDAKESFLNSIPEAKRGNPEPVSRGRQAPESAPEDEDAEGRSESEQLVDEGASEAERDKVVRAARTAARRDRRES